MTEVYCGWLCINNGGGVRVNISRPSELVVTNCEFPWPVPVGVVVQLQWGSIFLIVINIIL